MICHIVTAKVLIIHRNGNTGDYSREAVNYFFNLTKLNSQATQLDLIINSSKKFNLTIWGYLRKIACLIGPFSIQFYENVSCFFRKVHVTTAYSKTCYHKFSRFTIRQDLVLLIHNIYLNISIWCSNGNVFAVSDHLHGTAYGGFCRTITVHNISIRIHRADLVIKSRWEGFCTYIKNLNSGNSFPKLRQIDHIGQIGRCGSHNIYFIFYDPFTKHDGIQNFLIACDHCSHSIRKREKFLQYRNIKCHGCHGKRNASSAYVAIGFCISWVRVYEIRKVDMLDHNTFWFSG